MAKKYAISLVALLLTALAAMTLPTHGATFTANSWIAKAPMPTPRGGLGVAVVDGKIYAIGGDASGKLVGTNEEYNPVTDTWTTKAPMPTPRAFFAIQLTKTRSTASAEIMVQPA